MKTPEVYLLVRAYKSESMDMDEYFGLLNTSLESISYQTWKGVINVIINDDSPLDQKNSEYKDKLNDQIIKLLNGGNKNLNFILIETNHKGSSYAEYNVRKKFLSSAKHNDDIAILLDYDDELTKDAVNNIVSVMSDTKADLGVIKFATIDDKNLDIADDARIIHNKILDKIGNNLFSSSDKVKYGPYLCTMGWTKVFTKRELSRFIQAQDAYFTRESQSAEDFFKVYNAYEDFLDFYSVSKRGIKICGINTVTHIYHKRTSSITSKATLDDFSESRFKMLSFVTDIISQEKCLLYNNRRKLLLRYLIIKVTQIENILNKYRNNESEEYKVFKEKTYYRWFLKRIVPLIGDDKRDKKFLLKEFVIPMTIYHSMEDILSAAINIQAGRLKERSLRLSIYSFFENRDLPLKKQISSCLIHGIVLSVFLFFFLFFSFLVFTCDCMACPEGQKWFEVAIIGILPAGAAIVTFLFNKKRSLELQFNEQVSKLKLYCGEFEDMIRHLEANAKILIQIRKEVGNMHEPPASVHFDNLKIDSNSMLFADYISGFIPKENIDDFMRVRVNLRNINNSAGYMSDYVKSNRYDKSKMEEILDWEIARYFGYLANFYYFQEKGRFEFATESQLDQYYEESKINEILASLFITDNKADKEKEAKDYYRKYLDDRRKKRTVLFI